MKKNFFLAMAISGLFAGLAAAVDIFGWKYTAGVLDIQASTVGFVGIAVALLGRSTAIGVGLAAFIFGALEYGTTRGLDPEVFDPTLAGNLSLMIQGLVVLFVGADLLILYLWSLRQEALRIAAHVREGRMSVPASDAEADRRHRRRPRRARVLARAAARPRPQSRRAGRLRGPCRCGRDLRRACR